MILDNDLHNMAKKINVDLAVIQAIKQIEAQASGFKNGLPVILFERHIFYKQLKKHGFNADELSLTYPQLINKKSGGYLGGNQENYRLEMARQIDEVSAIESASWGLFQIMGYHWQALDYQSAHEFETMMSESEKNQLDAFYRFITLPSNKKILTSMKNKDFVSFAKYYNGTGYKKNQYDEKLQAAYEHFKTINKK